VNVARLVHRSCVPVKHKMAWLHLQRTGLHLGELRYVAVAASLVRKKYRHGAIPFPIVEEGPGRRTPHVRSNGGHSLHLPEFTLVRFDSKKLARPRFQAAARDMQLPLRILDVEPSDTAGLSRQAGLVAAGPACALTWALARRSFAERSGSLARPRNGRGALGSPFLPSAVRPDAHSSLAAIDSIKDTSWRCTVWSLILL
jgi:hypothetical protein